MHANNINNAVSTYLEQSEQIKEAETQTNTINRTKDVLVLKTTRVCSQLSILRLTTMHSPQGRGEEGRQAGSEGVEKVANGREGTEDAEGGVKCKYITAVCHFAIMGNYRYFSRETPWRLLATTNEGGSISY